MKLGRPKIVETHLNVYLRQEHGEKLTRLALAWKVSRSEVIRRLLDETPDVQNFLVCKAA
jgi:hypothetical protein